MARQIPIRDRQHRKRLALWTAIILVIALALPLATALLWGGSPKSLSHEKLEVITSSDGGEAAEQCWKSSASTGEKNFLGMTVMELHHHTRWCSDGEKITLHVPGNWIKQSFFGNWSLMRTENSSLEEGPDGTFRSSSYQYLTYKGSGISSSYVYCLEWTFHADGRAEVYQC